MSDSPGLVGDGEGAPPPSRSARGLARHSFLARLSALGATAQAAIPGLYAWSITVAPAAWSRGAPASAKLVGVLGALALITAPLVEGRGRVATPPKGVASLRAWTGPTWARVLSVWGFVLSSSTVWAIAPGALASVRMDGVRGVLGVIGWALFAFASAGPSLRADPESSSRIVAGSSLKPRSDLPRGDGAYVAAGVLLALAMQAVGWGILSPERAVLVRLVTVVCGVAVLGATTSIALARHGARVRPSRRARLGGALPWIALLVILGSSGLAFVLR